MPIAKMAASLLYEHLQRDGVEIHEYCRRPLHGKVAVVDDDWATVGSSNLDPLSLSLNLEANVMIRERAFNADLRARLERLMREDSRQLRPDAIAHRNGGWRVLLDTLAYHATRRFPAWAGYLPAHVARLEPVLPASSDRQPDTAWRPR
jgi:cardiolipin synthase